MFIAPRYFCVCVFAMVIPHQASAAHPPREKVLYRKTLAEGRELVVVQESLVLVTRFKGLLSEHLRGQTAAFCSISVELRSGGQPPLRLWSQLCRLERETEYNEFEVLDLLLLPDRVVVALAGQGSSIDIVEIAFGGPNRLNYLRGADWSSIPVSLPTRPGRLRTKLEYNEKEKRIEFQVTDSLEELKQHTLFYQKGNEWEFVPVKRWEEKVPATNPAPAPPSQPK
jgi:hypothetical protein